MKVPPRRRACCLTNWQSIKCFVVLARSSVSLSDEILTTKAEIHLLEAPVIGLLHELPILYRDTFILRRSATRPRETRNQPDWSLGNTGPSQSDGSQGNTGPSPSSGADFNWTGLRETRAPRSLTGHRETRAPHSRVSRDTRGALTGEARPLTGTGLVQ